MVQELVARLAFGSGKVALDGRSVLDYGCGTGVALAWLGAHAAPSRVLGLDASPGAIEFARRRYPGIAFEVLDIEAAAAGAARDFDVALCFEVIEHLHRPEVALEHLATRYLNAEGVLLVSTPNRLVFSAGMEPSPINRTHIHEMDLAEFRAHLERWFASVEIWGMGFRDPERMAAHARTVKRACEGYRLLGEFWWNPHLSRFYRWFLRGGILDLARGRQHRRWTAGDFEFTSEAPERAIWFYAVARRPRHD